MVKEANGIRTAKGTAIPTRMGTVTATGILIRTAAVTEIAGAAEGAGVVAGVVVIEGVGNAAARIAAIDFSALQHGV